MTTEDSPVLYSVVDGVARLELNRPAVYNALDVGLARTLEELLRRADEDDAVGAVLLSGRGKAFCAGGDVKAMAAAEDVAAMVHELVLASHRAVYAIARLSKPIVAAVHGSAAGAGLGYACAADLVVAGESAKFLSAFTAVGLTPDSSTSWFLPQIVGLHRAMELTLLNRVLSAREAQEWGLVNAIHPDDDLLAQGLALARRLASGPRAAYTGTRRLVRDALERSLEEHLEAEAASIVAAAGSGDVARLLSSRG